RGYLEEVANAAMVHPWRASLDTLRAMAETTDPIRGRVALITGASSGIGLAVAEKLVAEGAKVALVARTAEKLEAIAVRLGKDNATAFPCDVKDFARLAALPVAVVGRFGRLDILVNNAGLNHRGPIYAQSADNLAEVITTNLTAPIYLTRACA